MFSFKPLKPGVVLMRRLRLPTKLGILALVLTLPLLCITVLSVQRLGADLGIAQDEIDGTRVVRAIDGVMRAVQSHRAATIAPSGGDGTGQGSEDIRRALADSVVRMDAVLTERTDFQLQGEWTQLKARVEALASPERLPATAPTTGHDALVQDLRQFIYTAAERSSLLFDPVPATYFLMDMAVSHLPAWGEMVAQMRRLGAVQLAQPVPDLADLQRIKALIDTARSRSQDLTYLQRFLLQHGQADLGGQGTIAAVTNYLDQAERALASPGSVSALDLFNAGASSVAAIRDHEKKVQDRLQVLLVQRVEATQSLRTFMVAAAVTGLLLVTYLMLSFYFSFVIDFRQAVHSMRETAAGNLRTSVVVRGGDELAELAGLLRQMNAHLSATVAEVRSSSALVAHSGQSLAAGNRDLTDRTEQQAANLQQTAASVQQLASTVQQNAQAASDSDAQAAQVRDVAESGSQAMTAAVDSVAVIQQGARQMNEIIGVIDSLAFQTNILALNAAVEAARAGEQGRGFAVVANEVRTLAQRSASASREIRELIQASSSQVDSSVKRIQAAGDNMSKIVSGVRSVATNMSLISAASAEQSSGLGQISTAVNLLDEITQRNGEAVERAARQASQLATRAGELSRAVSSFKLQQGTAEEAIALVTRALEHRTAVSRETFVQDLTRPEKGFHDRDMYVFALDRQGCYRAFGGKPEKVGSRVQDIPGVDGQALLEAIIAQAEAGLGWVEYDIVNPQTGTIQAKMSYVTQVDDLYVGCGVYKSVLGVAA